MELVKMFEWTYQSIKNTALNNNEMMFDGSSYWWFCPMKKWYGYYIQILGLVIFPWEKEVENGKVLRLICDSL